MRPHQIRFLNGCWASLCSPELSKDGDPPGKAQRASLELAQTRTVRRDLRRPAGLDGEVPKPRSRGEFRRCPEPQIVAERGPPEGFHTSSDDPVTESRRGDSNSRPLHYEWLLSRRIWLCGAVSRVLKWAQVGTHLPRSGHISGHAALRARAWPSRSITVTRELASWGPRLLRFGHRPREAKPLRDAR